MTDIEIKLLSDRFEADKEAIINGNLLDHEEQALAQLRAAEEYLASKYPALDVDLVSFDPSTIFKSWGLLEFRGDGSQICEVRVFDGETGYECKDTYFSVFLAGPYDQMLQDKLLEGGYPCRTRTCFFDAAGLELGPEATLDDFLAVHPRMPRNTHIFIGADHYDSQTLSRIRTILHDAGCYGSYTMYLTPSLEEDTDSLEKQKERFDTVTFQCFDL